MSIYSKLSSLLTAANNKTGESDTTLTDAVQTLIDGYGQGGGGDNLPAYIEGALTTIDYDEVTSVRAQAFREYGSTLTSAKLHNATTIGANAFYYCSGLTALAFPSATSFGSMQYIQNLEKLDIGPGVGSVPTLTDNKLNVLVLRRQSVVTLGTLNVFNRTPFASGGTGGTLYVPNSLISSYQSATNWSTILGYANNSIQKIEGSQYETHYADGTVIPT